MVFTRKQVYFENRMELSVRENGLVLRDKIVNQKVVDTWQYILTVSTIGGLEWVSAIDQRKMQWRKFIRSGTSFLFAAFHGFA